MFSRSNEKLMLVTIFLFIFVFLADISRISNSVLCVSDKSVRSYLNNKCKFIYKDPGNLLVRKYKKDYTGRDVIIAVKYQQIDRYSLL
jgi:hypothetical protein